MEAVLFQQRVALALASAALGTVVSWVTQSPVGLLAPTAALFLFARGRIVALLHATSAIGLAASSLVMAFTSHEAALPWVAFFALALCIGAIIAASASPPPSMERVAANHKRPDVPMVSVEPPDDRTMAEQMIASHAMDSSTNRSASPKWPTLASASGSVATSEDKTAGDELAAASFWAGIPYYLQYWRRQPSGGYRWTALRTKAPQAPTGIQDWSSIRVDIDDQKSGEQQPTKTIPAPSPDEDDAIRAAKITERLFGHGWAFDIAGRPTYLTPVAQAYTDLTLEDFQAAVDDGYVAFKPTAHPEDYDHIAATWRHSLQTGEPFFMERRVRRAPGVYTWARSAIVPTRDSRDRVTGWYGVSINIDAYRRTEAALRESEHSLRELVDMVPVLLWRLTPDGEPAFFNRRMIDFLGLDVAAFDKPGMSRLAAIIGAVTHPDDAAGLAEALHHSIATGERFSMRYRLRRADGVYRWMDGRAEPLRDEAGQVVQWYGLAHDVDDQVRAQEAEEALSKARSELAHVARVTTLGALTASIAHEVSQPLSAIITNAGISLRMLAADPPNIDGARESAQRTLRDGNRATDVIARLRALFRKSGIRNEAVDLTDAAREVIALSRTELQRNQVVLRTELAEYLPTITGDRVQLQQVILNLILNASEAMSGVEDRARRLMIRTDRDGADRICLAVQDTGPGVDPHHADRLFEAFFTTKKNGMGIGLSVSRLIIESHHGRLWVEPNSGPGVTFFFSIPIESETPDGRAAAGDDVSA